jgi:SAM-dependent methyltransferase
MARINSTIPEDSLNNGETISKFLAGMTVKRTPYSDAHSKVLDMCPCCHESSVAVTLKYQKFNLWQCTICQSLIWLGDYDGDLKSLYNYSYFHTTEYLNYTSHQSVHEINAARKWSILKPFLPKTIRLLEIGCAYGYFSNYVRKQKVKEVFGFDISEEAINEARKNFGDFFTCDQDKIPKHAYNCLTLWDVWEHLKSPSADLKEFYSQLSSGGLLALTTLDAGSLVASFRKSRWRQIHPPTHINYPTRNAIQRHLKHHGFDILLQKSFSPARAIEVYLNALGINSWPWPKSFIMQPLNLNLMDTQIIVARKK